MGSFPNRIAWLATTALSVLTLPAHAQSIAAGTTPQGAAVVGGSANISQAPGSTTIHQSSARTAIDWQSFNVGSAASVHFVQPNASAIALNRVVAANPSIIAGRIDANGQIVLINQSGVVFSKGSQVNAESIFVTTSDIATKDFMAGRLDFSGSPAPGAKIENDGQLTAKQAGLVGLVAPQVLNNGVITASLGQVVLAGATAFTLDLYGDRLISLDVTKAVSEVDIGGKKLAGLVTNQGVIIADGGKITLTAMDADALVTALIQAGGTMRTDNAGAAGSITLQAVGGDIRIAGSLLARGTSGGVIAAAASGSIAVAKAALLDASGDDGGGRIVLGNALGGTPKAAAVSIAAGARLQADAMQQGDGGSVLLDSVARTDFAGSISVQGGPHGGNGGLADISSAGVISLTGTVTDTAIDGRPGEVLLDPATLVVGSGTIAATLSSIAAGITLAGGTDTIQTSYISPAALSGLSGTIVLQATTLLSVAAALDVANATLLSLTSGGAVTLAAGVTSGGGLEIDAATSIAIDAPVSASYLSLSTGLGNVTEAGSFAITAATLSGSIGGILGLGGTNVIGTLGNVAATGSFALVDQPALTIAGAVSTTDFSLEDSNAVTELATAAITAAQFDTGSGTVGGALLLTGNNSIGALGNVAASRFALADSTSLAVPGTVQAADVELAVSHSLAITGTIEAPSGTIALAPYDNGTLDIGGTTAAGLMLAVAGFARLDPTASLNLGNAAGHGAGTVLAVGAVSFAAPSVALSASSLVSNAAILTGQHITLSGGAVLNSGSIDAGQLDFSGNSFASAGNILAGILAGSVSGNASLGGSNEITALGALTAGGNITLADAGPLSIAGTVAAVTFALDSTSTLTEPGSGDIDVAEFEIAGQIAGGLSLTSQLNTIGALGNVLAAGNIVLVDHGNLTIAAVISTPGSFSLDDIDGTVSEPASAAIDAMEFDSGGGTRNAALLLDGNNAIGTLGEVTSGGAFSLVNGIDLVVTGPVQASGIALVLDNPASSLLQLNGALSVSAGAAVQLVADTLSLGAGGTIAAPFGTIAIAPDGGTLDIGGTTGDGLTLPESIFAELDSSASLVLGQAAGHAADTLLVSGSLSLDAVSVELAASTLVSNAAMLQGDAVILAGGAVSNSGSIDAALLDFSGSSFVSTGNIAAGTLTGDVTGDVSLTENNEIGTLGAVNSGGNITLVNAQPLVIGGVVTAAGSLALAAGGAVTELTTGGIEVAEFDTDSQLLDGGLSFTSFLNMIGTLGNVEAIGDIDLANAAALVISGPVFTFGSFSLDNSGGAVTEPAAAFIEAAEFDTGNATIGGALQLLGTENAIGRLGGVAATGNVTLVNDGSLSISGIVSAPVLALGNSLAVTELGSGGIDVGRFGTDGKTISGVLSLASTLNHIDALGNVAATGNIRLVNGAMLAIGGTVSTPGSFSLDNFGGAVTEVGSGVVDAMEFDTNGTIGGGLSLNNSLNAIGTLGGIAATGGISLADGGSLSIAGFVSAPSLALAANGAVDERAAGAINVLEFDTGGGTIAGGLSFNSMLNTIGSLGNVAATGKITLADANALTIAGTVSTPDSFSVGHIGGTLSELAAAAIDAGEFDTGNATIGGALLLTGANSIGTLGNETATGSIQFDDLDGFIAERIIGHDISLSSGGGITLNGLISSATVLELSSGTGVSEASNGIIDAPTLQGADTGADVMLENQNSIFTLAGYTLGGSLMLTDMAGLTIAGTVNVPAFFSLSDSQNVIETGAGRIIGGSFSGTANNILLTGANTVGQFTGVSAAGTIALDDSCALDAQGITAGGLVSLNGGGLITLEGTIRAATLAMTSAAGIDQAEGVIDAGILTGSDAGGDVSLGSANSIGSLGFYSVTGDNALILNDAAPLTITGPVDIPDGMLVLTGSGAVTAPGMIMAATLTTGAGTIAGNVALTGANSIGTLGAFDLTGSATRFTLDNGMALNIDGEVQSAMFVLADSAPVQETGGGVIDAGTFGGSITGNLDLALQNTIGLFGNVSATGSILLDNPESFVAGRVTGNAISLDSAGSIALEGLISSATVLNLESGAGISEESGGLIDAATLQGTNTSLNVVLENENSIVTLGNYSLGGSFSATLRDLAVLTIAGALDIPGMFSLTADQGVVETGPGKITTGLFSGNAGGNIQLTGGNAIGQFSNVSAADSIVLDDAIATLVAQNIHGGSAVSIDTAGSLESGGIAAENIGLSGSDIALNGSIGATARLQLTSNAGIDETPAGIIDAATLTGSNAASGDVFLGGANSIAVLGFYSLTGNHALTLNDTAPLAIIGPVDVPQGVFVLTGNGPVSETGAIDAATLTTGTGMIAGNAVLTGANRIDTLGGFVTGPASLFALNNGVALGIDGLVQTGALALTDAAPVQETGGAIIAGSFEGSIAGNLSLTGNNAIGNFAATAGNIVLDNADGFSTGPVSGNNIALATAGSITIGGTISSATLLELSTATGVSEASGGVIDAAILRGNNASSDVDLGNENIISTLAGYMLGGSSNLIAGADGFETASGSGSLILNDAAALTIAGAVDVPDIFSLTDSNSVFEIAGSITGSAFSGSIGGDLLLTGANSIGLFTDVTTAGSIALSNDPAILYVQNIAAGPNFFIANDGIIDAHEVSAVTLVALHGGALDAGAISSRFVSLNSDSAITLNGVITAGTLEMTSQTGTEEAGTGAISATVLTGANAAGGNVLLGGANDIGVLQAYSVAGSNMLDLNDTGPLTIAGPVDVPQGVFVLTGNAAVAAPGVIDVATLTTGAGAIAGDATLTGSNRIGILGNFDVTGPGTRLALNDTTGLTINGAVQAGAFALTDAADVTEAGGMIDTGSFSTDAIGNGGIAGSLLLGGANEIDTLGRIAAGNTILLANGKALTIAGTISTPKNFMLDTSGTVTELGSGAIDAAEFEAGAAGGALLLTGGNAIGTLSGAAASDIRLSNRGPLTISGIISTPGSFALGNENTVTELPGGKIDAAEFDSGGVTIGGPVSLGGGNAIGTLGGVRATGAFTLVNDAALTLVGPVIVPQLTMTVNGKLTLLGSPSGGLFIKGAIESGSAASAGILDSVITVNAAGSPDIIEDGPFDINAGPNAGLYLGNNAQPATLFLNAAQGGGIVFAGFPESLNAPSIDLVLDAGLGSATGNVSVLYVEILRAVSTDLTGFLDGVSGAPASRHGNALPIPSPLYRFNACPIASVNCVLLQLETLPLENPLENFEVTVPKRRRLNARISLPGIATRDY